MILSNGQFRFVFRPQNYETSVAFYREGLGLSVDHEWDYGGGDRGIVFYAGSGMVELLGLMSADEYVKPVGVEMVVQVDNADRWFELAQERKLPVLLEPTTFSWGHRIVRVVDPDGIVISLFEVISSGNA